MSVVCYRLIESEKTNTKGVGMDTNEYLTEIKVRLEEIQVEMHELHETRKESALNLAISLGVEDLRGINLDELSMWARHTRKLNTRLKELADERRNLRATRRELSPCTCDCH